MMNVQTDMDWEKVALGKYQKMLGLIPAFHRGIAREVVNKEAEKLAKTRGASQVEEADIIKAFFAEVPKAFYQLMIRVMDEVGFDYKKHM